MGAARSASAVTWGDPRAAKVNVDDLEAGKRRRCSSRQVGKGDHYESGSRAGGGVSVIGSREVGGWARRARGLADWLAGGGGGGGSGGEGQIR